MFRFLPFFRLIIASVIVVSFSVELYGQQQEQNINELKKETLYWYNSGEYARAYSGYRTLLEKYPRDPQYHYYAGACLVKQNKDLPAAINHLSSAVKDNVPADAWYQLAIAYQREYRFDEARDAIEGFIERADRQEMKAVDTDLFLASVAKAKALTKTYNPYNVLNVTFMNFSDSSDYRQVRMKGGDLVKKPDAFFARDESRNDMNSFMFMPSRVGKNEYVYYSAPAKSGRGGFQLYRIKKGIRGTWLPAEELSALNSNGNEILPYFDPIGQDIYFASDGYPGIGGFDLFKSHFDEEKNDWTSPVNMGFPVNSSADDYLILPGYDLGVETFFSTRQGTDSTVTVYRVHFKEPKQSIGSDDPGRIMEVANLGGVAAKSLEQLEIQLSEEKKIGNVKQEISAKQEVTLPEKENIQKVVPAIHPSANTAYQKTLREALVLQSEADSLSGLAIGARVKIRDSDDPNDRWLWQKQILVWEKRATGVQASADSCYGVLATLDKNEPAPPLPEAIEKDTVINDLTVYKFKQEEAGELQEKPSGEELREVPGEPGEVVMEVVTEQKKEPEKSPQREVINRFEILSSSPYSDSNPIPLNMPVPQGSFYRIQLGAFSKPVANDAFGGLTPVTGETSQETGLTKYFAGKFSHLADAQKALGSVRANGYPDAYIIAWYNGSPISVNKAKELEL